MHSKDPAEPSVDRPFVHDSPDAALIAYDDGSKGILEVVHVSNVLGLRFHRQR